jgi:hypothetical protein
MEQGAWLLGEINLHRSSPRSVLTIGAGARVTADQMESFAVIVRQRELALYKEECRRIWLVIHRCSLAYKAVSEDAFFFAVCHPIPI